MIHRRTLTGWMATGAALHLPAVSLLAEAVTPVGAPRVPAVTADEVVAAVRRGHPRLLVTDPGELRAKAAAHTTLDGWAEQVVADAERVLQGAAPSPRPPVPWAVAGPAGNLLRLAGGYALTGRSDLLARVVAELDALGSWATWLKSQTVVEDQFIEISDLAAAFALAYDWCHHALTGEQRSRYVATLVDRYLLEADRQLTANLAHWVRPDAVSNWVPVCHHGIIVSALAIMHDGDAAQQGLASRLLVTSLERVRRAQVRLAPDGGCFEGTHYWWYGTRALVGAIRCLATATGGAYDLDTQPGMAETGWFPVDMTGPVGTAFNWGDCTDVSPRGEAFLGLGRRYQAPGLVDWALAGPDVATTASLAHVDPAQLPVAGQRLTRWTDRPTHAVVTSVQNASGRSTWSDRAAIFLAFKGGVNGEEHGQLDLGDFVLDAGGYRWVTQLGPDRYSSPYWDRGTDGQRWTFYRAHAQGNNTLCTDEHGGQRRDARAPILSTSATPERFAGVIDLDQASDRFRLWRRGFALTDHRRQVVVRDEVSCWGRQSFWWFVHTAADVTLSEDRKTATLRRGGETMVVRILAQGGDRFTLLPAEGLWDRPVHRDSLPVPGVQRLAIRFENVAWAAPTVAFSYVPPGGELPRPPAYGDLAVWTAAGEAPSPQLADLARRITVDGAGVPGFDPDVFTYHLPRTLGAPRPRVEAPGQVQWTGDTVPVTAKVRLSAGGRRAEYHLRFVPYEGLEPGAPVVASAESWNDGQGRAVQAVDGDLGSRWAAEGEAWLRLDLGEVGLVDRVRLGWFVPVTRFNTFSIDVSDGGPWRTVLDRVTSDGTANVQTFEFGGQQARFVRYRGDGTTARPDGGGARGSWNSVTEFQVPGRSLVQVPARPAQLARVSCLVPGRVPAGGSVRLAPAGVLSDGTAADLSGGSVTYRSSDPAVVDVTGDGQLRAVADGTAEVAVVVTLAAVTRWVRARVEVGPLGDRVIPAAADTWVRGGGHAHESHGRDSLLHVKGGTGDYEKRAVIGFGVVTGTVSRAVLRVTAGHANTPGATATVAVWALDPGWDETTLTHATLPTVGTLLGRLTVPRTKTQLTLDVTGHVRTTLGTGTAFLLAETPPAGDQPHDITIDSREGSATTVPTLEVTI